MPTVLLLNRWQVSLGRRKFGAWVSGCCFNTSPVGCELGMPWGDVYALLWRSALGTTVVESGFRAPLVPFQLKRNGNPTLVS